MVTVVTSFGPIGAHEYGYRFLDSFARCWPADVKLIAYVEAGETHPRAETRDLLALADCTAFLERHRHIALHCGRLPTPAWKPKEVDLGYGFRTDAVKFCRKVFAVYDAAQRCDDELLVWMDADVMSNRLVPTGFLEGLMGGADLAYLGRGGAHSECGFLGFRLPAALPVITAWRDAYDTDRVFELREWHDSFVFDVVRRADPAINARDLTPGGSGHVWIGSPLGQAGIDHLKGDRKKLGYSPEMVALA